MTGELQRYFIWAWEQIGARGDPSQPYNQIIQQYRTINPNSQRVFHTEDHAENAVRQIIPLLDQLSHAPEAILALTGHDVIYDSTASDNEVKSAVMMKKILTDAQVERERINRVVYEILATDHLGSMRRFRNFDVMAILDSDLSILGVSEDTFDWYDEAIRTEYAWVSDEKFKAGRLEALRKIKGNRRYIYRTGYFRELFEDQAKLNIARAIKKWELS